MPSKLWQRIKAARSAADLTQAQVAAACGVTRAAVAYWESGDPKNRTHPSVDQLMTLAKLARVPPEWLLDDKATPDEVWKVLDRPLAVPQSAVVTTPDAAQRLRESFWRAVEFRVLEQSPDWANRFGREVSAGAISFRADYLGPKALAIFASAGEDMASAIGRLLAVERIVGRALHLHLLVWDRQGLGGYAELGAPLHVEVVAVASVDEAAGVIQALG